MSLKKLNRRLTGTDAFFLYVEGPRGQMNIGICHLYEGHISREEVIQSLSARMHLLPRYRQKVVFPPLRLAHPTWEEDPAFDIRNHVEERTLPPGADDKVLAQVSGELLKPWMDHSRPLWKLTLLHGCADGNTAIVWEVHHAMVDGMSAIELIHVMHDQKANVEPPPPPVPWQPRPLPDKLTLCQDAVRSRLTETVGWLVDQVFSLFRPSKKIADVRRLGSALVNGLRGLKTVPRSPFTKAKTSGDRQGVWVEFPLTDVRTIRSAFGGSINDVAFAVIAGGMGRYMRAHSYPTEGVMLRTLCPVSLRQEDERGMLGNIISMVAPPLYVGIDDPARRIAAGREGMEQIKRDNYAGILDEIMTLADRVPPAVQRFSVPLTVNTIAPRLGVICSNVPGPQIPLYFAGRKLLRISGIAPMPTDVPIFNVILSYDQRLVLTPTVDPKCIPDPWFYVECLKESFAEVLAAAQRSAASVDTAQEAAAA